MSRISSSSLAGQALPETSAPRAPTTWQRATWGGWTDSTAEVRFRRWRPWGLAVFLLLLALLWRSPFGARVADAPAEQAVASPPTAEQSTVATADGPISGGDSLGGMPAVAPEGVADARVDDGEPLEPIIGADGIARPTVRILAPEPNTLVTGSVQVRWESAAAVPITASEIFVNGRQVVRLVGDRSEKRLDMRYFDGGDHTIEVTVYDENRRKGSDRRAVRVRNPTFALQRLSRKSDLARNGEELVIDLFTNGSGFTPRADLGPVDSGFDEQAIDWSKVATDHWQLTYRLSRANQRPDGSYWMAVTLEDSEEPSITDSEMVRVQLANYAQGDGLREVFDMPCAVYRPDPVPPASRESPRLLRVVGPSTAETGETVQVALSWDGSPGRESRFLRVSVDGLVGHYVLHGKCGLQDIVEIVPKAVTDQPLRVAVWPSEGLPVVHRLAFTEAP